MPFCRSLFVVFATAGICCADQEIRTLDNQNLRGQVVSLSPAEVAIEDSTGAQKKIPLSQVLSIYFRPAKAPPDGMKYTLVKLFDDSELYCSKAEFAGNKLHVRLLSGQEADIPLTSLTGLLRDAQNNKLRKQFDAIASKVSKADKILVLRNDILNALPGALGDVDPKGERIQFRREDNTILPIKIDKLHGMLWHRIKAPAKNPVCLVIDTMGNSVAAMNVSVQNGNFIVTTHSGDKISFAESTLSKLDYNRGKLTFLSDLLPSDVVETSAIGLIVRHRKNKNLDGQTIFFGKTPHAKGLSMHAHSELEYNLKGKFKEFKAIIGVDAQSTTDSKAVVVIKCDNIEVFSKQVDAENPQPIAINVRNVEKMRIIVRSSNILDLHDHATLADARIIQ